MKNDDCKIGIVGTSAKEILDDNFGTELLDKLSGGADVGFIWKRCDEFCPGDLLDFVEGSNLDALILSKDFNFCENAEVDTDSFLAALANTCNVLQQEA